MSVCVGDSLSFIFLCVCVCICVCVCSLDLASLLQKPAGREEVGGGLKAPSSAPLGHSLVFTNSHHHATRNGGTTPGTASYAHATLVREPT